MKCTTYLEDLDFSPREVIAAMVDRAFPTTLYQDVTDPGTGKTIQVPVRDSGGNSVQSQEALRMKQQIIDGLSALELPENPLDQLVNHFGERDVAELTGRTRRLIRDSQGRVQYKSERRKVSRCTGRTFTKWNSFNQERSEQR